MSDGMCKGQVGKRRSKTAGGRMVEGNERTENEGK